MKSISAQEAKELLKNNEAIIVDVREPDEYLSGFIPSADLLPLSVFESAIGEFQPESDSVIFYCKAGVRSAKACQIALFFLKGRTIYNLAGGIDAWTASGFELEKI